MADHRDQGVAVREDVDSLARELRIVSASLEEVATTWRRSGQYSSRFPARIQEAADRLVTTVHSLAEAGAGQPPDLAAAAAAQLSALKRQTGSARAVTRGIAAGDSGLWAMIEQALDRASQRLWSIISRLDITGLPVSGHPASEVGVPPASGQSPK